MEVEEIVKRSGGFGRVQVVMIAFTFATSMFAGMPAVQDTFINYTPDYRCLVPSCDATDDPQFAEDFVNFTIPEDSDGSYSQCSVYKTVNETMGYRLKSPMVLAAGTMKDPEECVPETFVDDEQDCPHGYVYDRSLFETSTTMEFDFTCSRGFLAPFTTSAYTIGMLLGSVGIGFVSDFFGRKTAHLFALITYLVGAVAGALSVNTVMLMVARAVAGVGATAMFNVSFVILVEFMPVEYRTTVGMCINMIFAVGEALVGVTAIYVRRWRELQLLVSVPSAILLFTYWYVPESLRWLINQKKYDQAEKLVHRWCKINRVPPIENIKFKDEAVVDNGNKSVLDLLRSGQMRAISLNMFYIWFASNMVYYGTSQNSGNLSGNIFVNFISIMLIEIPSYICVALFMDRLGHKTTLFFMMLLATVSCLICGLLPTDATTPIVVLSLIGKFGGAGCFGIVYVYATEIFPTSYRSIGVGACSMFARLSGIFSPLIAGLGLNHGNLPLLIFGGVSAVSLVSCLFLPETVGVPLPQTLQECEDLARAQGMFDFLKCGKKRPGSNEDSEGTKDKNGSVNPAVHDSVTKVKE